MADNFPTLMDVARQSGDKKVQSVVEVLNQTNEALDDIPWIECNSGVTHITTVRTGVAYVREILHILRPDPFRGGRPP